MKSKILILLLALQNGLSVAQTHLQYQLDKYSTTNSSLPVYYNQLRTDLEHTTLYALRNTTSLMDRSMNDSLLFLLPRLESESNVVIASFSNRNAIGDFLHEAGKRQTEGQLLAGGQLSIPHKGTLFGMVAYRNNTQTKTSLNYAVHPEDYAPYWVGDTLATADVHQEIYNVTAGYSRSLQHLELGVDANYEGIALSQTTDPKRSVYYHQMRVGVSLGKVSDRQALSLRLSPEWSRQSISASSMIDGIRYFNFYGFGLWNRRESQSAISYSRTQTMRGGSADLLWMYRRRWQLMSTASYLFRHMQTEEGGTFKNLFESNTHHLSQQLFAQKQTHPWSIYLQWTAFETIRKGKENVYEQQLQDAEQGLYDYRKVATNALYSRVAWSTDVRAKVVYNTSAESSLAMMSAFTWQSDEEKYLSPSMKILHRSLSSTLAVEYKQKKANCSIEVEAYARTRMGFNNQYTIAGATHWVQQVMAFRPYQLRAANQSVVGGSIAGSIPMGPSYAVGARLHASYTHSDPQDLAALQCDLFFLF